VLKAIARVGVLQLIGVLIFVVRVKTTAVLLGPAGVGVVSVVDQFVQLVLQLSAVSLPFAAVKFLSLAHSRGQADFQSTYHALLNLLIVCTALGAGTGLAIVAFESRWLDAALGEHRTLLATGLLAVPAMALHGFFRNVLAAAQRPRAAARFDVVTTAVMAAAVTAGVIVDGITGYFVGLLAGAMAVVVGAFGYLRGLGLRIGHRRGVVRQQLKRHPDLVQFLLIMYVLSFTAPLSLAIVRTSILTHFGQAQAGLLQAAIAIGLAVNLVLNPVNGLLLTPVMNRDISKAEKFGAALEFQGKLVLVSGILAGPLVLFPDLVVTLLYTKEFVPMASLLFWFVVGQVLMQISGVGTAVMIGFDRMRAYGVTIAAGHAIVAAGAWLLAPAYGLAGVAVIVFAAALAVCVLSLVFLRVSTGFSMTWRVGNGTVFLVAALLIMGWIASGVESTSFWSFVGKSFAYLIFVFLLLPLSLPFAELRELLAKAVLDGHVRSS
jgi:O-antigen/teichoic acid export membrane protein